MDIGADNFPETSTVGVEISLLLPGFIWKFRRIIAQEGILYLKLFGTMAGCRSQQEDSAVNNCCRPFEKSCEMRVPALSRTSSTGTHERSIGAGSRGERLALEKT
jgi:hypothetical protein